MKTNFAVSLLTLRLDFGAKVRSQTLNPAVPRYCSGAGTLLGALGSPPALLQLVRGERGRARKGCFGLVFNDSNTTKCFSCALRFAIYLGRQNTQDLPTARLSD